MPSVPRKGEYCVCLQGAWRQWHCGNNVSRLEAFHYLNNVYQWVECKSKCFGGRGKGGYFCLPLLPRHRSLSGSCIKHRLFTSPHTFFSTGIPTFVPWPLQATPNTKEPPDPSQWWTHAARIQQSSLPCFFLCGPEISWVLAYLLLDAFMGDAVFISFYWTFPLSIFISFYWTLPQWKGCSKLLIHSL